MSELTDLRAAFEMSNALVAKLTVQLENEKAERNHYAEVAARVLAAEAALAAQEGLVKALTDTKDPLSPMAALATVSKERDEGLVRIKELEVGGAVK